MNRAKEIVLGGCVGGVYGLGQKDSAVLAFVSEWFSGVEEVRGVNFR